MGISIYPFLKQHHIKYIILGRFFYGKCPRALVCCISKKRSSISIRHCCPNMVEKECFGHHVHEAVISNKEVESGITIHYVDEHYDHGTVIFSGHLPGWHNRYCRFHLPKKVSWTWTPALPRSNWTTDSKAKSQFKSKPWFLQILIIGCNITALNMVQLRLILKNYFYWEYVFMGKADITSAQFHIERKLFYDSSKINYVPEVKVTKQSRQIFLTAIQWGRYSIVVAEKRFCNIYFS